MVRFQTGLIGYPDNGPRRVAVAVSAPGVFIGNAAPAAGLADYSVRPVTSKVMLMVVSAPGTV